MKKYAIGLDFGTLSVRALVVDAATGQEMGASVQEYPHAVMDRSLPCGKPLGADWALQDAEDYICCMQKAIAGALNESGVSAEQIIGLGLDFTTATLVAVGRDGLPLSMQEKYRSHPHAYVKLWKHHAAQAQATRIENIARARGEKFLSHYAGISSEWVLPKVLQMLEEAPEVYEEVDCFLDAGDYMTYCLTGLIKKSSCLAGYKSLWNKKDGFPSREFLKEIDPRLENIFDTKLRGEVCAVGECAGPLSARGAQLTGLIKGTAVAVGTSDAHVSPQAAGIVEPGRMLMIIGTSTCDMLLSDREHPVEGMCGMVEDGIVPGYYGYESGQGCCGDHFDWFVKNCVPESYAVEARERGISLHQLLTEKAAALRVGQSGLVALDWWNGNRSILQDSNLSGLMIGMMLTTRPEEIYRALIEATAYGARRILETYEAAGEQIDEIVTCGGIAHKNPFLLQVYADVTGRELTVARSK